MTRTQTLKRHAGLVDRMAGAVGLDLEQQAIDGKISIDEISDSVLRCTECPNPGHCEAWLSRTEQASQPPEYCRNADLFARLQH